jgi:hypothetical protein
MHKTKRIAKFCLAQTKNRIAEIDWNLFFYKLVDPEKVNNIKGTEKK